jgi:hypothetical protein
MLGSSRTGGSLSGRPVSSDIQGQKKKITGLIAGIRKTRRLDPAGLFVSSV